MNRANTLSSDREYLRRALYMMLAFNCHRYCLCTFRGESAEKADIHWEMSAKIASLIWGNCCDYVLRMPQEGVFGRCDIHEFLTPMTDNMDTELGMPIGEYKNNEYFDSTKWGNKMFEWIWNHWDEMCNLTPDY